MYNSAVSARKSLAGFETKFEGVWGNDNITVFKHDICTGMNDLFRNADAVYSSLAWKNGYEKFTHGSIAEDTSFDDYINGLKKTIRELGIPAFLICGSSFVKKLEPDMDIDIFFKLHNYPHARVAIYNYSRLECVRDEDALRDYVGRHFRTVLDPSCGYGNLIPYCQNTILSDINDDCLNHIVKQYNLSKMEA